MSVYFPEDTFDSYVESPGSPFVVSPRKEDLDLISWAEKNQLILTKAIREYGAIVFSGFNVTKEAFSKAFAAITGTLPTPYKGDTPRDNVYVNIYKSTAVANGHAIPLHQEVAGGFRENMPKYISFYCVTPPQKGTGQTQVGNVETISLKIQQLLPNLWKKMCTTSVTYTTRYLPSNSWRTNWIRWFNPSHATIEKRFGTHDRQEIERKCKEEGLTCEWDGEWAVVSRKGVPATFERDGKTYFCNAIHLDKFSPKLCGGWINYIFARILLYPTRRSMQFDVQFDDGTPITLKEANTLIDILKTHQRGRDWKEKDIMVLDNVSTMHAKTVHIGQREILVAMGGRA